MKPRLLLSVLICLSLSYALAASSNETTASATANIQFKTLLKKMLDSSAAILGQQAVLNAAKDNESAKSLYWTPQSASLSFRNTLSGSSQFPLDSASAALQLNLLKFGANQLAKQSAQAASRSANALLSLRKEETELLVSQVIFDMIRQQKLVEIQKRHLELRQESFRVAGARFRQGQFAAQEFEKVKMEHESAKVSLNQAELDLIQYLNSLKTLADLEYNNLEWPFSIESQIFRKKKLKKPQNFFSVESQFEKFQYHQLRARQIWRESYLPSFDFRSEWSNLSLSQFNNGQWNSYFLLTIPIWDQFSSSALVSAEYASAQSAKLLAEQAQREATQKVRTIERRFDLVKENVQSAKLAAAKLNELRNDSLRRFKIGRSSVNDLLIDENRYLEAETALLSSMRAYHLVLVELCHSAGESLLNCFD